jgi:hypothetical protein
MLITVPLFALLLKITYLFSGRLYLEHLVVALYSQSFIFVLLSLRILIGALGEYLSTTSFAFLAYPQGLIDGAIAIWLPLYLLLTQKFVYRQGWWLTIFKFFFTGIVYSTLLLLTLISAFFWSFFNI